MSSLEANRTFIPRRLAAILAADAANFSGLVAEDEERTLRQLARHRTVIDGAIASHEGRIVTTAGDSVLAEFASPVQAVRAAVAIQRSLAEVAARTREGKPMRFRIGINLGDVVVDGDNVLGDGVNIAVRLESIAQPGAIVISSNVRDHIVGKIPEATEDLGHQFLKNIPNPVRAYRIVFDDAEERALAERLRRRKARSLAISAALALIAVGFAAWWNNDAVGPPAPGIDAGVVADSGSVDERTYWSVVSRSGDPAELRSFLDKYPQGTFAELARARLSGLLAARAQHAESTELMQKSAEAARAQAEAIRLKAEADAAIARAASEQAAAMRLKTEADLAAARAAGAAKAVAAVQQRLARPVTGPSAEEQIILVRGPSPYDGRWTADWTCESSADQPSSLLKLPVLIQQREIRIETGQAGLPGYYRAYGKITDDGSFDLKGSSLPKTQRIVGSEQPLAAAGRGETDKLEGQGNIGTRRCVVVIARGSLQ